ncbi:MAG: lysylphosphatidylglycerol synthase domain-containing protein [Planctomycetaceae bacterium]|nr:lysylphosphatidylglycerol synthase domain-containing protein [Planctomycetaceae bacterium]
MNISNKKLAFAVIKWLIVVLVVVWVMREISKTGGELLHYRWEPQLGWLLLAVVCYLVGYLPAGIYWHIILRKLGQSPTFYETIRAYYIGHLGKYIPGKAMVVAIRAGLVRSDRVKTSVAVASVFLETLTMMAVGAMISAILLFVFFREQTVLMLVALGLMVVSGLPVVPFFFRKIVKIAGAVKGDEEMNQALNRFNSKTLLCGWGLMSVAWLFLGLSLCATINGVGISTGILLHHLPRFVAASALSTVVGFLSMLPGGLGVREMVLSNLMYRYFEVVTLPEGLLPHAAGLVVAGVARLISLVSELVVTVVFYLIKPRT